LLACNQRWKKGSGPFFAFGRSSRCGGAARPRAFLRSLLEPISAGQAHAARLAGARGADYRCISAEEVCLHGLEHRRRILGRHPPRGACLRWPRTAGRGRAPRRIARTSSRKGTAGSSTSSETAEQDDISFSAAASPPRVGSRKACTRPAPSMSDTRPANGALVGVEGDVPKAKSPRSLSTAYPVVADVPVDEERVPRRDPRDAHLDTGEV